jgi:Domain of unknown function (DUF6456)
MRNGQNRGAAAKHLDKAIGLVVPHGSPRELEEVREVDPDGRIVVHNRLVDSLGRMRKSGGIDEAMYDASRAFQAAFTIANLDPVRALPILRVPGGRTENVNERQIDARRRVHAALQALGGINSPAGSCVWHVVGLQRSVREWAMRQGWSGRPVRQEQAQGILIAALGVLAGASSMRGQPETGRAAPARTPSSTRMRQEVEHGANS